MAPTSENSMTLRDWLDDLCVRFIINIPSEELTHMPRICFQIEEAQWFYEDFIRPIDSTLPMLGPKEFCQWMFRHCPILSPIGEETAQQAYQQFIVYKKRVPVRGAILLNERMDKVVLVKGWKKTANWSFPRGKVNKDEDPLECAIRELYEETGFDVRKAALIPDEPKYIDQMMRDQDIRLYVIRNVPEDTIFEPQTRKEISEIKWWNLSDLPNWRRRGQKQSGDQGETDAASRTNRFYMVASFMGELRRWVHQQRKKDTARAVKMASTPQCEPTIAEEDEGAEIQNQPQELDQQQQYPLAQEQEIEPSGPERANNDDLKRLLNIQGGAMSSRDKNPTSFTDAGGNKGSELLALLQGGSGPGLSVPQADEAQRQVPHTPMDHTYVEAPEPESPHHHHTQPPPLSFSTYASPPTFPYNSSHNRTFAAQQQYQNQTLPENSVHYIQTQPPGSSNPAIPPPFLGRRHLRHESIPLVHPQPLPPQVQTGLLTHGMNGTPAVPDAQAGPIQPPGHQHQQQQHANPNNWQVPQPYVSPQGVGQATKQTKPPLNTHSRALLGVFKGNTGQAFPGPANPQGVLPQNQQYEAPASQYPCQPGPGKQRTPAGQNPAPQGHAFPGIEPRPTLPSKDEHKSSLLSLFKTSSPAKTAGPTDAPSRAVAGQFGNPVGMDNDSLSNKPPQRQASGTETHGRVENQGNGVCLFGHDAPRANNANMSQMTALRDAAKEADIPVQMNPEVTLPNRTVGILARSKQNTRTSPVTASNTSFPSPRPQNVGSPLSNQFGLIGLGSPRRSSPKNIKIQKRPETLSKLSSGHGSQHRYGQQGPIGSPYGFHAGSPTGENRLGGHMSPAGSSFGAASALGHGQPAPAGNRGQQTTAEHKQNLLLLFGRGGEASSTVGGDASPMGGTPRSHVLSMASGHFGGLSSHVPGAGAGSFGPGSITGPTGPGSVTSNMSRQGSHSRRGSQTPISPADRDFLFGYLNNKLDKSGR